MLSKLHTTMGAMIYDSDISHFIWVIWYQWPLTPILSCPSFPSFLSLNHGDDGVSDCQRKQLAAAAAAAAAAIVLAAWTQTKAVTASRPPWMKAAVAGYSYTSLNREEEEEEEQDYDEK